MFEVMTLTEKGNDDLTMPKLPVHIQDLFERSTMYMEIRRLFVICLCVITHLTQSLIEIIDERTQQNTKN